jgi:RNA polymerase sigma factor (sigma-70 family)
MPTPDDGVSDLLNELDKSPAATWREFLTRYAGVIQQVVGLLETETDQAADCFLFVCERLVENDFRRLRKFRPSGSASFPTWLRAVVRNLSIDWHRKVHGRPRDGAYPIQPRMGTLVSDDGEVAERLRDPQPDPEVQAASSERSAALSAAIGQLEPSDRLLLRMRFEQDLTLDQVARLVGLKDAQTVDRRLRQILERLRATVETAPSRKNPLPIRVRETGR